MQIRSVPFSELISMWSTRRPGLTIRSRSPPTSLQDGFGPVDFIVGVIGRQDDETSRRFVLTHFVNDADSIENRHAQIDGASIVRPLNISGTVGVETRSVALTAYRAIFLCWLTQA